MQKIALFTCHHDPNYGSMLQAYALAAVIKKMGNDAEYINYSTLRDPYSLKRIIRSIIRWPIHIIRNLVKQHKIEGEFDFFRSRDFKETMLAYERFHIQYIPVSAKRYYSDTIKKKLNLYSYDIYMVGSDQSWSPHLYRPNKPYLLDFADLPKRCAYAPSLGTTDIPKDYLNLLKQKLSSFDHISCREATNSKLLTEVLGREVTHVLDPTLLLTCDDWDKVAKTTSIKGDYILAYILGEKDTVIEFAEKLGNEKNLPVYYIVTRPKYLCMTNALNGIGPDDWVGLVRSAKYVVTDSYHGCLFCINYNVNFYAFSKREGEVNSQDNVRILEFLRFIGLEHRFQDDKANLKILPDIDFSTANQEISSMRQKSLKYLSICIED